MLLYKTVLNHGTSCPLTSPTTLVLRLDVINPVSYHDLFEFYKCRTIVPKLSCRRSPTLECPSKGSRIVHTRLIRFAVLAVMLASTL
jgi:hypothetical protein